MDADDGGNERLVSATPAVFESTRSTILAGRDEGRVLRGAVGSTGSTTACG